jgi:hypothetical protein
VRAAGQPCTTVVALQMQSCNNCTTMSTLFVTHLCCALGNLLLQVLTILCALASIIFETTDVYTRVWNCWWHMLPR